MRVAFAEQLAGGGTDVRAAPVRHRRSLPGGAFPYGRNSGEDIPVHVLIVYGTSKGQTYKLACVPAARMVRNAHRVLTAGCSNASVLPARIRSMPCCSPPRIRGALPARSDRFRHAEPGCDPCTAECACADLPLWRGGGPTDTRRDYELTDWNDLAKFVDEFTAPETPPVRAPTAA